MEWLKSIILISLVYAISAQSDACDLGSIEPDQDLPGVLYWENICIDYNTSERATASVPYAELENYTSAENIVQGFCAADLPAELVKELHELNEYNAFYEELGDGVYYITNNVQIASFVISEDGVLLQDCPPALGIEAILAAVAEVTDKKINKVIYSHAHADHIGCVGLEKALGDGVEYIAAVETLELLVTAYNDTHRKADWGVLDGGAKVPLPTTTFKGEMTLKLDSNHTVEMKEIGVTHIEGNLFTYYVEQKVLTVVDVVQPGWNPFGNFVKAESASGFLDAMELILEYDFDHYIGGHLHRPGTKEDVETQISFIDDIRTNAVQAMSEISVADVAMELQTPNFWQVFEIWSHKLARRCTQLTYDQWLGKLGAVDVFTYSHCSDAITDLRIN